MQCFLHALCLSYQDFFSQACNAKSQLTVLIVYDSVLLMYVLTLAFSILELVMIIMSKRNEKSLACFVIYSHPPFSKIRSMNFYHCF